MKTKLVKTLLSALLVLAMLLTVSCDDDKSYEMTEYYIGDMNFAIPSHFDYGADEEAEVCFATVSAWIRVYMYEPSEIEDTFPGFSGKKNANDFADFLVTRGGYNVDIDSNGTDRAIYDMVYTTGDGIHYYYTNILFSYNETVYMIAMECHEDKVDVYSNMFTDVIESVGLKES